MNPQEGNTKKQTVDPQNYFVTDMDQFDDESKMQKMQPYLDTGKKGLIRIWPSINRGINTFLFYLLKIVRGAIRRGAEQLKF